MLDNFIFRRATEKNISAVYALYKSVIGEKFCAWSELYPDMTELNADLNTGNLFVLADGETIIGAISVVPENELEHICCWSHRDGAEIARVVVAKEYRGHGIAGKMVGEIEKILCQRGFDAIHLSVAKANIPAYKTYIKAGFKTVAEAELYGGNYYLMEKALSK